MWHAGSDVMGCRRPTGGVFKYVSSDTSHAEAFPVATPRGRSSSSHEGEQHSWESSKAKATAEQKEHKGSSHILQNKKYLYYPLDFWANILWTDETKVFGRCVSRYLE